VEPDEETDIEQARPQSRAAPAALVEAHVAEYLALRSEIEWLIKDGSQYQGFAIALLAAALPVLQFLSQRYQDVFSVTLLVIPFLFCLLGLLYFRQHEEVYVIAAYLATSLRPRVRTLTGDPELWGWEEFKAAHGAPTTGMASWVSGGRTILVLRALLFVVPSLLAVVVAAVLMVHGRPYLSATGAVRALMLVGLALDAAITLLLLLSLAVRGNLAGRLLALDGIRADAATGRTLTPLMWFADRARRSAGGALGALASGLSRLRRAGPDRPG
jgi:hypothetical protein